MSLFQGNYLRVLTPRTVDGNIPLTGPDGRVIYKESHLPLTARKRMESKNLRLPKHLQHVIQEVDVTGYQAHAAAVEPVKEEKPKKVKKQAPSIEDELQLLDDENI